MHASHYLAALAAAATTLASPITLHPRQTTCTPTQRLAGAALVITGYNAVQPGDTATAFAALPLQDACKVYINANGLPAVPVALDAPTTRDFALATRQVFSKVTGEFTDYTNGTTIIHTNVVSSSSSRNQLIMDGFADTSQTLGAAHAVALPVTFAADVYLDYDLEDCLIGKIQAFATVPSVVAGVPVKVPDLGGVTGLLEGLGLGDLAGKLDSGVLGRRQE